MDILENHFPSYDNLYIILFDKYTKAVPIQLILWDVFLLYNIDNLKYSINVFIIDFNVLLII